MPKVIPGQRKRWPRKDAVVACRLAHPTWSTYQIAAYVGCSHSTAWYAIKAAGLRCARNPSSRKLQEHELQSVADLYAEGVKSASIAAEYGITEGTVRGIARRRGLPPRDRTLPEYKRQAIVALCQTGYTYREIGEKYGLTRRHIRRIAAAAGYPARTPWKPRPGRKTYVYHYSPA